MTPYQYVTNNPIMFTDPTGMEGEGWIETNAKGTNNTQLTYDSEVNTIDEAVRKGYKNVKNVENYKIYASENGSEYLNLNKDGSVTDLLNEKTIDVGFNPIRTSDGIYISENNTFKSTSTALQNGGDAIQLLGLAFTASIVGAEVGAPILTAGTFLSGLGTLMEISYSIKNDNYKEAGVKLSLWLAFSWTGGAGVNATRKDSGGLESEFVKKD